MWVAPSVWRSHKGALYTGSFDNMYMYHAWMQKSGEAAVERVLREAGRINVLVNKCALLGLLGGVEGLGMHDCGWGGWVKKLPAQ